MVPIGPELRQAALFPAGDLPPPPPEHPYRQVARSGYWIGLFPGQSFGTVTVERIDDVEAALADVRQVLADDGKSCATWFVSEAASPAGLAASLVDLGIEPWNEAPFEPRYSTMALAHEPPAGPPGVEARRPVSIEEFSAGQRIAQAAFAMGDDNAAAMDAQEQRLWEMEQRHDAYRSFVALVDGEVVAGAACIFGRTAAFLVGGYTREDMRGRGIYRALVRARWDAAVERGTPALTVGAGRMSRPILEQLGFEIVDWVDCLRDDFA